MKGKRNMKTIKRTDIKSVPVEDLKPGMILAEGVLISDPRLEKVNRKDRGTYFLYLSSDTTPYARPGTSVQVLGRLDEEATALLCDELTKK